METSMIDATVPVDTRHAARLHPLAIRIMHWLNAAAMLIMILSGWAIYNDEVIFGWLHFPNRMTLGDGPEGALQWHFLAMWVLAINGLAYLLYGLATGRFRRMLLPIRIREVIAEIRSALALRLSHDDLTRYNAVQRVLYISVILVGVVQVLSGLVVWKPVQFSEFAVLFGDFPDRAPHPFPGDGRHRRLPPGARDAGAAHSADAGGDGDRRPASCARAAAYPRASARTERSVGRYRADAGPRPHPARRCNGRSAAGARPLPGRAPSDRSLRRRAWLNTRLRAPSSDPGAASTRA
jgi:thiosulfate reductase cytochrome b subunit